MPVFFRLFQYCRFKMFVIRFKKQVATFSVLLFVTVQNFPLQAQTLESFDNYIRQIIKEQNVNETSPHKSEYYLLQLSKGTKIASLTKTEIKIIRSLHPGFLIVKTDRETLKQNASLFKDVKRVNDRWKLAAPLQSPEKQERYYFSIKAVSAQPVTKALTRISSIKIIKVSDNNITLYTSLEDIINHVIPLEEVIYAGIESNQPREESRVLDLYLSPNTINKIHHSVPTLNGEAMTLSIREPIYNAADMDLIGRNIPSPLSGTEVSNHATDMATIAAGAGNSFITGKGVARASSITSSDYQDLFPDKDEDYTTYDAWVQNHSYGTEIENFYGARAEAYDLNTNRLPHLLHVFSSGNQGAATDEDGPYKDAAGFANLTGNFKMAKNILTIGSVDTVGRHVSFSSRGPAYDGRVKPELVAYSTQGSSNSAALVSGTVILLQQAFKQIEGAIPSSALLKSLLINSAMDAGAPGIDFTTGYGNVDADRTLNNLVEKRYFSGSVQHGETKTFDLDIPPLARDLKVTIVWNDPAAAPNAAIALVNDLDLSVENGTTFLPWILDAAADKERLVKPATRGIDRINNIEQISIPVPQPGTLTISVEGFDVPAGPQQFFIAYQWDLSDQFSWTFPTGSDNIPYDGETGTYFFWKSTLANSTGILEYSIDEGVSWNGIASVDLSKGYYRWKFVPDVTASAQARMVVGNITYPTDMFTISRPPSVSVGFNCADSVMIQWRAVAGAEHYEIYSPGSLFLTPFAFTTDTTLIIRKDVTANTFYAVQPVLKDGKQSIRSPLFDYELLGSTCFLISFLDEVIPE